MWITISIAAHACKLTAWEQQNTCILKLYIQDWVRTNPPFHVRTTCTGHGWRKPEEAKGSNNTVEGYKKTIVGKDVFIWLCAQNWTK